MHILATANYTSLGDHATCHGPVAAARMDHAQVNGCYCYFCSRDCHTD